MIAIDDVFLYLGLGNLLENPTLADVIHANLARICVGEQLPQQTHRQRQDTAARLVKLNDLRAHATHHVALTKTLANA